MTKLVVPTERFSAIDYFLEKCDIKKTKGIKLTNSAYNRMTQDPYLKKESVEHGEKWIGEEVTINGRYYPPLSYVLCKKNDGYMVSEIEYEGHYCFSLEEFDIIIDY